jgi:hypothetical protein
MKQSDLGKSLDLTVQAANYGEIFTTFNTKVTASM